MREGHPQTPRVRIIAAMPPFSARIRRSRRAGLALALLVLPLAAGGCSEGKLGSGGQTGESGEVAGAMGVRGEAGLEVTTFGSAVGGQGLGAALTPYVPLSVPISRAEQELWEAHGLRMVAVPMADVGGLMVLLQSSGASGGGGGQQRQWLGQAYTWTEIARGAESGARTIALDAERIRLSPGALRLLVRAWLEPVPPSDAGAKAPGAALRLEIMPQHRESVRPESMSDPLAHRPAIDAESQGLLFSRLYARLSVPAGHALLIVSERPGVVWREVAQADVAPEAAAVDDRPSAEAQGRPLVTAPGVGQVVRAGSTRRAPQPATTETPSEPEEGFGPASARVPTLGEAMLGTGRGQGGSVRTIVVLTPRVPREFHLLGPVGMSAP